MTKNNWLRHFFIYSFLSTGTLVALDIDKRIEQSEDGSMHLAKTKKNPRLQKLNAQPQENLPEPLALLPLDTSNAGIFSGPSTINHLEFSIDLDGNITTHYIANSFPKRVTFFAYKIGTYSRRALNGHEYILDMTYEMVDNYADDFLGSRVERQSSETLASLSKHTETMNHINDLCKVSVDSDYEMRTFILKNLRTIYIVRAMIHLRSKPNFMNQDSFAALHDSCVRAKNLNYGFFQAMPQHKPAIHKLIDKEREYECALITSYAQEEQNLRNAS